ncbi:CUB domain-containing protein 1a [Hypomesus transpacificus]|uniref:CUB domain-containing protein 1a n=1 Tax=Hypomesus transpacificus TaxID=137520 RepID=UPI001F087071|nr:CUB domain-containing protein 1a [Hypomesus transpacificus]
MNTLDEVRLAKKQSSRAMYRGDGRGSAGGWRDRGQQRSSSCKYQGTTFNISRRELTGSKCAVCSGGGLRKSCSSSVVLRGLEATPVEISCLALRSSSPSESVQTKVSLCAFSSCREEVRQTDLGSRPLQGFARTFSWTLRASGPGAFSWTLRASGPGDFSWTLRASGPGAFSWTLRASGPGAFSWTLRASGPGAFLLDFSPTGLTQIQPAQACPDQHTYSLQAFQSTGAVVLGAYCGGGSVSGVQLPRLGQLSLEIPGRGALKPDVLPVVVGEDVKSLAVVTVTAPGGTSSTELFSPNYPDGFPDDDLMEWRLAAQPRYSSSITFLGVSGRRCLKKEAGVGYQRSGSGVLGLGLDDPQPTRLPGSFSLTLRNCEVDLKHPGLSLHLLVSTTRGSPPGGTVGGPANCIRVAVSPLAPPLVAPLPTRSCSSMQRCAGLTSCRRPQLCQQRRSAHLPVLPPSPPPAHSQQAHRMQRSERLSSCAVEDPPMPSCLPATLNLITWLVRRPRHAPVELLPGGGLTQIHPGDHHQCHGNVTLTVAEGDGTPIGHFCPQGGVGKVQVHANVTITATALEGRDLRLTSDPVINISFSQRISGNNLLYQCLQESQYTVQIIPSAQAGKEYTLIKLTLVNDTLMGINAFSLYLYWKYFKCTDFCVCVCAGCVCVWGVCVCLGCVCECVYSSDKLVVTILGVVGALLVVRVTGLAVMFLLRRKKKKQLPPRVSIYNPNGTSFLPGLHGNPKLHL